MITVKSMKIVITCTPEMGHFIPMSHIGEELAQRGHTVIFITMKYGGEKCL